jgi:hypothetical protein
MKKLIPKYVYIDRIITVLIINPMAHIRQQADIRQQVAQSVEQQVVKYLKLNLQYLGPFNAFFQPVCLLGRVNVMEEPSAFIFFYPSGIDLFKVAVYYTLYFREGKIVPVLIRIGNHMVLG